MTQTTKPTAPGLPAVSGPMMATRPTAATRRHPPQTVLALLVLTGQQQGAIFPIGNGSVVGRDEGADVTLTDSSISRKHAQLVRTGDGVFIDDLSSRNGTFLGDVRVREIERLEKNDHVRVGHSTIVKIRFMDELELRALATAYELTLRDSLTRLYNRRYFDERIESELSFARRHGSALALLMIDLDDFKQVNDLHGHQAGDAVLRVTAATVQRLMRPEDTVARYGGDELAVIARGTSLRNSEILAKRICFRVDSQQVDWDHRALHVTASVGATASSATGLQPTVEAMIQDADAALYAAKGRGGNSYSCAHPPGGTQS